MTSVDVLAEGQPFQAAIDYFRQKIELLPTRAWTDIWEGMHSRAFVVAGAMESGLLSDFRSAVDKAIAQGSTLNEFRKDFDRIVQSYGWSYKGGRGWRSSVIFNTNLRTAYQAGHYQAMTDPYVLERRPFWRYVSVLDGRTRPRHRAWHNTVLRADDPWWRTHYPPNGWGCRCTVTNHSAGELERLRKEGESLTTEAPPEKMVDHEVRCPDGTVRTVRVPEGIDPGWAYNVGETAWGKNAALRLMEDAGPWRPLDNKGPVDYGLPEKLPLDKPKAAIGHPIPKGDEEALRGALRNAIGGDEVIFVDPKGGRVVTGQAIVEHILASPVARWDGREAFFPFIPETITDPAEIWVSFAQSEMSGRVALRKRYVKFVEIGKRRVLGIWAETEDGYWVAQDFFRGEWSGSKRLRTGRLLYARER